jgi:ABC-2 type transport system permease protein
MSKAITDKHDERPPQPGGWRPREVAPSELRADDPGLPRTLGMIGAALIIFGGTALGFNLSGQPVRVSTGWAILMVALGLAGLLFHAAFDRDLQFRRLYMAFGFATLVVGAALCLIPYPQKAGDLFRYAVLCLLLALLFFLAFLRNEDDPLIRRIAEFTLGGAGALMALIGLFGGNVRGEFLMPFGLILAVLGVLYLTSFVATRGISGDLAYRVALGLTAVGLLVALVAVVRSFLPPPADIPSYFKPYGFTLLLLGVLYSLFGAALFADWPFFVLFRRELGSFFYSPMAYLALVGFAACSWISYWMFLRTIDPTSPDARPYEPIIANYIFALIPVITVVAVVPVLTMRLLSEERGSGTLEVLLTAPVDETPVVLSKFFAAFVTYLVMWVPFALYLLAIPLSGGNVFDYRPLFSFLIGLSVTGAGFISMGLFCSSLTRSQVASFMLGLGGMTALLACCLATWVMPEGSNWRTFFSHLSFLEVWRSTLQGKLVPRQLLFFSSLTVLCLFLTVKVLESRKWR